MDSRTTTQRQAGAGRTSSEKENSRCFNCHSLGHFSTECPQPQMLLCYNCRELGHKTFECTKNLSCRSCGNAGHKERQCPQGGNTTHRQPPQSLKGGDLESSVGIGVRKVADLGPVVAPDDAAAARPGDGLLRLPQQPPLWRPPKKQQSAQLLQQPSHSMPKRPAIETFQDILSSFVDTLLSEPSGTSPPTNNNEMSLPPPAPCPPPSPSPSIKPFLPAADPIIRPTSPARSAPEMAVDPEDEMITPTSNHNSSSNLLQSKIRAPRDSSLQRIEKAARHLSFAAGGPNRHDYVAETDRLDVFRSRAGSSNTRMSTSWMEDETEWDGATMSFDNRYRQQSFCFEMLGRRPPTLRPPQSPLEAMLPRDDLNIVIGSNSTCIGFSWPAKDSEEDKDAKPFLANENAAKYRPSTNVVGRAIWLINPAILFQVEHEPPRSDWDEDCYSAVPPRPPTLAVSAPLDDGGSS